MKINSTKVQCDCEKFRESGAFAGWRDFDSFVVILKAANEFSNIPVVEPYSNVGLLESWYQCGKCQDIWRLVEPDPPFAGLWERTS